jgi:cation diffusion facilitator CzcD-associated flavoprotein CzcO
MNRHGGPATPLEVLIIGAGFAGICMGKHLHDAGITDFRIVDKAPRAGGTWYWNSYPGAACDVLSHFYCFSFEPNPDWSRKYSPWQEIQTYAEHCVNKYGLAPHMAYGREVQAARFDDASELWAVRFSDGDTLHARHVIDGTGGLHVPLIPAFAGAESFRGERWHSSQWRHDVDLRGKTVAVIGSAASAIQIVPEIAKTAGRVLLFQRSANYFIPRRDGAYRPWQKWCFRHVPLLLKAYRLFLFLRYDWLIFPIVKTGADNLQRRWAMGQFRRALERDVADPDLRARLTPDYTMGCRRILISDHFYRALGRGNVAVVTEPIAGFEAHGIRTADDTVHGADAVVYATGFDTQGHHLDERVTGPASGSLRAAWGDAPAAYEGCMVAGFPNYYLVTGPNTGVGSTSVIFMIEQACRLILQCVRAAGRERLIAPTEAAMAAYDREMQQALAGTVWATGCRSWYKRADGRITALYPYRAQTWRRRHKRINLNHFEIQSRKVGSILTP